MQTITSNQLSAVSGGKSESFGSDGSYSYHADPSESCIDAMMQGAREAYPDKRWFFQRWFGADDPNARPRADYARDAIATACRLPAKP